MRFLILQLCALLFWPHTSLGRDYIVGPILADVVRVRDGDSLDVRAHIWPGQSVLVSVRIRGIDAPELRGKCASEKQSAIVAKRAVEQLVGSSQVQLMSVGGGKYYGRVLAHVIAKDGVDIARQLLTLKLARRYKGGRRQSWCRENAQPASGS